MGVMLYNNNPDRVCRISQWRQGNGKFWGMLVLDQTRKNGSPLMRCPKRKYAVSKMKIIGIAGIDLHRTSKKRVLFCKGRVTCAVCEGQNHYSFIQIKCEGAVCSSSQEGWVSVTGTPLKVQSQHLMREFPDVMLD